MHKGIFIALTIFVTVTLAQSANAYSYAEAEDAMVTIFKEGVTAVREGKWDAVKEKSEEGMAMQRGHIFNADALLPSFDQAIAKKDVAKTAGLFADLVYISIREKLNQCKKEGFKHFKNDKGRISMARKSYIDVLDGNVRKQDAKRSEAILKQFDVALVAIGNPGLFGIGTKPANPARFEKAMTAIEEMITSSFTEFTGGEVR